MYPMGDCIVLPFVKCLYAAPDTLYVCPALNPTALNDKLFSEDFHSQVYKRYTGLR